MSGEQELGVTESKNHNTGEWYAEVVQKAKLADYAPMGGFIVTRPRGYELWERLQNHLDGWFKETGAQNAYFPLLIPESFLEREADIVEGFDPEVAWVTHGGYDELEERLAVRPTSESIITPFMADWTRSHRDLPLRLNQWASVVRWEATETKPFFRTKEFLWQEGHTAHETEDGAFDEVMTRLGQYEKLYEDVLAIPVLRGKKPEHDKFPGADVTTTVEALMPDGKSVQGGTSHALGQSFAEAYDVTFTDENEEEQTAWTTSWGLSWRALGALVMTHSDDQGLVLPPAVAPEQVVVVPIWQEENKDEVLQYATEVAAELEEAGDVRVHLDERDERNPGFKFNEWELKGVPLRIEIGPNEVEDEVVTAVRRSDNQNQKRELERSNLVDAVDDQLDTVFDELYETAAENLVENVRTADEPEEIMGTIGQHGGFVKTAWCGDEACEEVIKEKVAAEIAMLPLEDGVAPEADVEGGEAVEVEGDECTMCGEPATEVAYFAKTY
jgi:prolyl-tRNA synthetase